MIFIRLKLNQKRQKQRERLSFWQTQSYWMNKQTAKRL